MRTKFETEQGERVKGWKGIGEVNWRGEGGKTQMSRISGEEEGQGRRK